MNFSNVKKGEVLSETQFYTVKEIKSQSLVLTNDEGQDVEISSSYAEALLTSGLQFSKTVELTRTELTEKVLSSSRIVMSVNFNKQVKESDVKKALHNLYPNKGKLISHAEFKKNVNKALSLKGEERTMVGRHYGSTDGNGRLHFIDMQVEKISGKDYDTRSRLVDPRTLNWAIIDGVKYKVK